ncbi:MAG: glycosyltransferase family 2 protein [Bacteroidota bacterium]
MCKATETRVWVLIPTYNEAEVIRSTVEDVLQHGYEVVLIDDGSTDNTRESVSGLPITYLRHKTNLGQGAALESGMAYARKHQPEVIVHFDADGQHAAADIEALIQPILQGKSDVVQGSRFLSPSSSESIPFPRILLLKLAVVFHGLFTGIWLSDAHIGLRALHYRAYKQIQFSLNGMGHATEFLMEVKKHRLSISEVPASVAYTPYSLKKGKGLKSAMKILREVIFKRGLS